MRRLCETLEGALEYSPIEIPSHITDNLSKELRIYQETALKHYLLQRKQPKTNHLMFNMATGSGKTLVMASLILDCYQRGYQDFVFFVNSKSIVEKTKANFADPYSSKYLFKEQIIIDNSKVDVNIIESLDESREGCINIIFTTVQSLFSLLKYERENALCFEDLKNRKLVFLADEAHHLNSDTKNASKEEQENKEGWEAVIQKAFESHPENLMLEFSATIPKEANILEKYQDKIVFEYDLKKFCQEGYSKRIFLMKYGSSALQDRFLGGILLSLYRELLAQKYEITLKPVVLFKSESINVSKANQEAFVEFLEHLDAEQIKKFYDDAASDETELFSKSLSFFREKFGETYLDHLVGSLKTNFKPILLLNTNDDKELEKNQILLNTLESTSNDIRAIFTVDKLNEGWDVLNLFDIVRLGSKSSTVAKTLKGITTREVQLIGRGARYYPFKSKNVQLSFDPDFTFKRKFDADGGNELSVLERLTYHTLNDLDFIKNLNETMMDQGLLPDDPKKRIDLIPNEKLKDVIKSNRIYYAKNERIRKQDILNCKIPAEEMSLKIARLELPLFSKGIKETEETFEKIKEEQNFQHFDEIGNIIPAKYLLKAMNMLGLSFQELSKNFAFESKKQFIEEFLNKITVRFAPEQNFNPDNCLAMALYVLENFKSIKQAIKRDYEITDFKVHRLNLGQRIIFKEEEKIEECSYGWLFYNTISKDSKLERDFLAFIASKETLISEKFSQWFIVRNDGFAEFKLYDNRRGKPSYGDGFEPDFIFFGKKWGEEKGFLSVECFIEAKGEHLIAQDKWKEDFLLSLDGEEYSPEGIKHLAIQDDKLTLHSLPFFRSTKDSKETNQKFSDAFKKFIQG